MDRHAVSVVIPAYNALATLERAIDSVLGQSRPAAQIVVVDDGSGEDLGSIRERYAGRVEWIRQPNAGAAAARNRGIEAASGNLIAFLDADDYWEPEKLARQVRLFRQHPHLGLCCGRYFEEAPGRARRPASGSIRNQPRLDEVVRHVGRDAFEAGCCVWTGTVVVRRELLQSARFRSGLEPAEDRDLWIRLIQAAPSMHLGEPLATAVLEPGSLSRTQIDRDCRNMLRIVERSRRLLGVSGTWYWRQRILRRWAAEYLGKGEPVAALRPALRRLGMAPWSPEAWWIASKCVALRSGRRFRAPIR